MKLQAAACVVLFTGFLVAVAFQTALRSCPELPLHGVFEPAPVPVLTCESWFQGEFQQRVQGTERKAGWIDDRLGFRSIWIRNDNQISFSVFHEIPQEANPECIVVGKDNWLFEQGYIDSLLGMETQVAFPDQMESFASSLKILQEELQKRGITMLVVISPSKATIDPEYLPDWVGPQRERLRQHGVGLESIYTTMASLMNHKGVNWIDSPTIFQEEKEKQRAAGQEYRLFARGGTHWTYYGAYLIVSEILDRLEQLTKKDLTNLTLSGVVVDCETTGTDNDLGDVINTWTPWATKGPTPHPQIQKSLGSWRPNVLWCGSSYSHTLTDLMDENMVYRRRDLLFSFRQRFTYPDPKGKSEPIDREHFDWSEELFTRDVVIIELNETTCECSPGFVEGAVQFFEEGSLP